MSTLANAPPALKMSDETLAACHLTFRRRFSDGGVTQEATSSGFLWRHNGKPHLVTCWHCVTGINPDDGSYLGTFTPTHVTVKGKFTTKVWNDTSRLIIGFFETEIALYDDEGSPNWLEHPNGKLVDIVVLRLTYSETGESHFKCINDCDFEERWMPDVGADAFIVGFPEGLTFDRSTPIWKRASIASEPNLPYLGRRLTLLDCVANSGLSGSLVIAQDNGVFMPNRQLDAEAYLGRWRCILGVYAGRMGRDGVKAQLGRVWSVSYIGDCLEIEGS